MLVLKTFRIDARNLTKEQMGELFWSWLLKQNVKRITADVDFFEVIYWEELK